MTLDEKANFNGVHARSGSYLFDPLSASDIAALAQRHTLHKQAGDHPSSDREQREVRTRGVKAGIDNTRLEHAGWGVIFPWVRPGSGEARVQAETREALSPLLELRRAQATRLHAHYYQEYVGPRGYRRGESKLDYIGRIGAGVGPADPDKVPYYLLIVGSPLQIPFRVQHQIDVQYAVGRIHFDEPEDYEAYARSVVAAESSGVLLPREIAFVGVANPDDGSTRLSREHLVEPLATRAESWEGARGWKVSRHFDEGAAKGRVSQLFGGSSTPALIFTASHGVGFDEGDPLQRRRQGALLLQDWPGPEQWRGRPLSEDMYFSGDDLGSDAKLHGLISFNFACYGGGTPQHDGFSRGSPGPKSITKEPFVAGLHRRMLRAGALATIGHVDRVWTCSFMWRKGRRRTKNAQLAVFESALATLMQGKPVGVALEYFNERYAEIASDLNVQLKQQAAEPEGSANHAIAELWTSNNDARGYGILGDPAVRLCFGDQRGEREQAPIEVSSTAPSATGGEGGRAQLTEAYVSTIARALATVAWDTPPLEVRTYLGSDVEAAAVGKGDARLGALSRMSIDGNMEVFVADDGGAIDPELLKLHLEMVRQAQQAQLELIRAIVAKLDPDGSLATTTADPATPETTPATRLAHPPLDPGPRRYALDPACPRYLVVTGVAASFPGIDTYRELASLWAEVEGSAYPLKFVTMVADSASGAITQLAKYEVDIDIIHLASHGESSAIEFPDGSQLTPAMLARVLAFRSERAPPVSLLYVNTCHSAAYVEQLGPHVAVIVAAEGSIGDAAAIQASNAFYRSLARKDPRYEVISAFERATQACGDSRLILYIEGRRVR